MESIRGGKGGILIVDSLGGEESSGPLKFIMDNVRFQAPARRRIKNEHSPFFKALFFFL